MARRLSKVKRQQRIAELLGEHSVSSQERVVELLAEEGVTATQATVSRDLDDLGAIKVRAGGGASLYAIPDHPHDHYVPADSLRRVFSEWLLDAEASGNIVVLRTPPGSAHVVASAIDRASVDGVLGTVAGDDTLMVIADADTAGTELADRFREFAGH